MNQQNINRREFIKQTAKTTAGITAAAMLSRNAFATPHIKNTKISNKVIVLGIDGMDPVLLQRFIDRGEMPTFEKFMRQGNFSPLQTTMPPQSPVAWASFITGSNPGKHGIYDFIHREPETFIPYLSISRSFGATKSIDIGKWSFPIKGAKLENLRKGPAFWTTLEENNIPASLFKLPANFPTIPGKSKAISGMGTPDLTGGYGSFTYFTDQDIPGAENFTGGRVIKVQPVDHVIKTTLEGPPNELRTDKAPTKIDVTIYRDPRESVAKIVIQDKEIFLKEGEFSEWVPLKFKYMSMFASVSGMVRIYMQQVHPEFRLYMTPINIDPMDPTMPISNPSGYSKEISEVVGRFYTQGFPEDTKALSNGVFSNDEFLQQSKIVLEERLKAFDYEFGRYDEGFFFYYFSSIDQNTHMMWRNMDPAHPLYEKDASQDVKDAVYYYYKSMDDVLKQALGRLDSNSTLFLMSDHGFAPFGREINMSSWLVENGYTGITDKTNMHRSQFFDYVDWSKTKAYAMGLNGIYINLYGREVNGAVLPSDFQKTKDEIIARLLDLRDPVSGKKMIASAYDSQKIYSGPYLALAPDIIVGYARGYRISDESVLGKFPKGIVGDRTDKWAADHCMESSIVPGVLLTNKRVGLENPGLWDLAPTILNEFGLDVPEEMDGKPVFKV